MLAAKQKATKLTLANLEEFTVGSLATSGERNLGTSGALSCQKFCSIDNEFAPGKRSLQSGESGSITAAPGTR
jgi:hypothetical protein